MKRLQEKENLRDPNHIEARAEDKHADTPSHRLALAAARSLLSLALHRFSSEMITAATNGKHSCGKAAVNDVECHVTIVRFFSVLFERVTTQSLILRAGDANEIRAFCKGIGVLCICEEGIKKGDLIGEYIGEVYPPWRWFEKEATKKRVKERVNLRTDELPEFYNMILERPSRGYNLSSPSSLISPSLPSSSSTSPSLSSSSTSPSLPPLPPGYDVLFVDPKKKGTFTSRLSHSCKPNAATNVISSGGSLTIAMCATRNIEKGEEITFDYLCRTDSEAEMQQAVCLCGSSVCRGSFLSFSKDEHSATLLSQEQSFVHTTAQLLSSMNSVSSVECDKNTQQQTLSHNNNNNTKKTETDPAWRTSDGSILSAQVSEILQGLDHESRQILARNSVGWCMLHGLPLWVIRFAVSALRYTEYEHSRMPSLLLELHRKGSEKARVVQGEIGTNDQLIVSFKKIIYEYTDKMAAHDAMLLKAERIQSLAVTYVLCFVVYSFFHLLLFCFSRLFTSLFFSSLLLSSLFFSSLLFSSLLASSLLFLLFSPFPSSIPLSVRRLTHTRTTIQTRQSKTLPRIRQTVYPRPVPHP